MGALPCLFLLSGNIEEFSFDRGAEITYQSLFHLPDLQKGAFAKIKQGCIKSFNAA